MISITVIGAGAAGFSAAMELADRGYHVILIEKNTLFSGATGNNPGRMGHGFHYVHLDTAKMYLRASIEVQRKYPGYLIGQTCPIMDPLRHGRYFVMKDSDTPLEDIEKTYAGIQAEYARLIAEDPANEVFGPADRFYRELDPSEYASLTHVDQIAKGFETAEHLFDFVSFAHDARKMILAHPKIDLHEHTEITEISRGNPQQSRFRLHTQSYGLDTATTPIQRIVETDYVVNSAWQNIEYLNHQIGIPMPAEKRTNRLKALLVVELPNSLMKANSMFFCMGQHCMYSNMGNGRGMLTLAKKTNLSVSSTFSLSDDMNKSIQSTADRKEIQTLTDLIRLQGTLEQRRRLLQLTAEAEKLAAITNPEAPFDETSKKPTFEEAMLQGVAAYIPEMAKAKIVELKMGIVRTAGELTLSDLTNPNSSFHKRDYNGIREEEIGLISNPCMKLFYFVSNGKMIAEMIDNQVKATQSIKRIMRELLTGIAIPHRVAHALRNHMDRYTSTISGYKKITDAWKETSTPDLLTPQKEKEKEKEIIELMRKTMIEKHRMLKEIRALNPTSDEPTSYAFYLKALCSYSLALLGGLLLMIIMTPLVVAASIPLAIVSGGKYAFFSKPPTTPILMPSPACSTPISPVN